MKNVVKPCRIPHLLTVGTLLLPHIVANYSQNVRCSCGKTRCLKLYCDCLKAGRECGIMCTCKDCLNKIGCKEREKAIEFLNKKSNNLFQKIENTELSIGRSGVTCSCQRSQCNKKYCSCYLNRTKCSEHCTCTNCTNK